jgi:nicotinamidase-related amidase
MPSAILVVDVQKGIFETPEPLFEPERLVTNLAALIERARAAGAAVFYMQHCGPPGHVLERDKPGWPIAARIAPRDGDTVVEKEHPDSFQGTDLDARLRSRGIDHLVIAGIATEYCIDTTCRRAYAQGYRVTLASDAHTSWPIGMPVAEVIAHHNRVLARFAGVTPVASIVLD